MQEVISSGSRELGQISVISTVFFNFSVWIPVDLEILSTDQENHGVDKIAIYKKLLAFWIAMARIRKILCAKVVHWIAFVVEFSAFWACFHCFFRF